MSRSPLLASLLSLAAAAAFAPKAAAAGKHSELEKCYQQHGQLEEVQKDGKKITTYKSPAEVAEECNEKVVAKVKGVKTLEEVKELASIVGRNSNWQSAVPVYTEGAKSAPKKAVCDDSDAWRSADLALSSPEGHAHSTGALAFFDVCWEVMRKDIQDKLDASSGSYQKTHLCKFLKGKNALSEAQKKLCA